MRTTLLALLLFLLPAALAQELVVYSGRTRPLVEPLVRAFEKETGVRVRVRYGRDPELLAALAEEGSRSPADLFWANGSAALAAAGRLGLLAPLPEELRARPAAFVPKSGRWVPLSLRLRVLAYAPGRVDPGALPRSVLELPELKGFSGRIGWTPGYASFQDFVTALRLLHGEETARRWLLGMKALVPKAYASNTAMLLALASGEIDLALTNHYYVFRLLKGVPEGAYEGDEEEAEDEAAARAPERAVAIHRFAPGDVGNLALVTGGGVLRGARHRSPALRFLAFLLSPKAQEFEARSVYEYPVVRGVQTPPGLLPVEEALRLGPRIDPERLKDLKGTLRLLREVGIL